MQFTQDQTTEASLKAFRQTIEADCARRGISLSFLTASYFENGHSSGPFEVSLYLDRSIGNQGTLHKFRGQSFTQAMTKAQEGVKALAPTADELAVMLGVTTTQAAE